MSDGKNGAAKTKRTKKDEYREMMGRGRLAAKIIRNEADKVIDKATLQYKRTGDWNYSAEEGEAWASAFNNIANLRKDLEKRREAAGIEPGSYKKGGKVRGNGCCKRTKKCKMY